MIIKSYEVKKDKTNFIKNNFFLVYGENFGLKKDIKDFITTEIKKKSDNIEILSFYENEIIYKQVVTPLSPFGDTVIFKNKWYGRSTSFTVDEKELEQKPKSGQNDRSNKHLGEEDFDKEVHQKYLSHIDINNLKGLKVELIYNWKIGDTLIMDRSHIHSSSSRIKEKKLGLTTFTKK